MRRREEDGGKTAAARGVACVGAWPNVKKLWIELKQK